MSIQERARAHGALAVPARVAVLDHLRACPQPIDAQAVAAAAGQHVTTVRFHLDILIEAGLVTTSRQRPHGRGRPRTLYAPAFQDRGTSGGAYRELADVLAANGEQCCGVDCPRDHEPSAVIRARAYSLIVGALDSACS